ncbi:hypothetical protein CK203_107949 [Vitis vinifera]|uniref:Uncharacterized protein n=1 Tax=Vitis vinifera TaxID=29760 RepID=A0A438C6P7_VITVI|nr:hypothetical protein CK203_107949 [Vitis vinifera]
MNGKRSPFSNSVYSQLGEAYQHYCLVPKSTFDKDALTFHHDAILAHWAEWKDSLLLQIIGTYAMEDRASIHDIGIYRAITPPFLGIRHHHSGQTNKQHYVNFYKLLHFQVKRTELNLGETKSTTTCAEEIAERPAGLLNSHLQGERHKATSEQLNAKNQATKTNGSPSASVENKSDQTKNNGISASSTVKRPGEQHKCASSNGLEQKNNKIRRRRR